MLLPPHDYLRPASLAAGLKALSAGGPGARLMGGGTDLVFNMRCRLVTPATVISLRALPELAGVRELPDGSLHLGAATRLTDLVAHPLLTGRYPALVEALRAIASRHVRNMATLGGNLCLETRCWFTNQTAEWRAGRGPCLKTGSSDCHVIRGSPVCVALNNADSPPALLALDAAVTLAGPRGERRLALADFYRNDGVRHTVLAPDEILTAVTIPPSADRMVFAKQAARQGMDFAWGTIAARADGAGERVGRIRLVLGSLTTSPLVLRAAADLLVARGLGDAAIDAACDTLKAELGPLTNLYCPAAYKRDLARALLRRALLGLRDQSAPAGAS